MTYSYVSVNPRQDYESVIVFSIIMYYNHHENIEES